MSVGLADVEAAAARLKGQIVDTPFLHSATLSEIAGCELWLKFENLQYTAAFKERGAYNRLVTLPAEAQRRGVIAMSAGNHAQGVAYHGRRLGIPATIVMPEPTPFSKIENTRRLGARVVLAGGDVDEAAGHARELAVREGLTFVHPFDDPLIVAGQGTVALEMLRDRPDLDAILVPIGGGGLIGGIAVAARALRPDIRIVGIEAELYPSVRRLLDGQPPPRGGPTIAEGIAVKAPGQLTMRLIRELVDDVLLVDEASIEAAVLAFLEIEKTVVEGAGAVGLAALLREPDRFRGKRVALVLSGGNIDSRLLSACILRGLVRTERLVRIRVGVPDSPGGLARVTAVLASAGGNVIDVEHQRAFSQRSVKQAEVDFTIETRNAEHAEGVNRALREAGFDVTRLAS
ncbi:MAG: threonine ammonia-lyase [Geminicoccaceae bacterium]